MIDIIIAGILASLAGYLASRLAVKDVEMDVIKGAADCEH